jgi:hypothetical protein
MRKRQTKKKQTKKGQTKKALVNTMQKGRGLLGVAPVKTRNE